MTQSLTSRLLGAAALAALALRLVIPTGLMPSSVEDGWFLKLCPDDMPAEVMAALLGEDDHHHHHHHHHGGEKDGVASVVYVQCDLGSLLGLDVLDDVSALAAEVEPLPELQFISQHALVARNRWLAAQARAPPVLV